MKNIIMNWRCWLMGIIAMVAFLNLIAMPLPSNSNYWLLVAYSKFTAAALVYFDIRLFVWFAKHRKIDEIFEFINEDE